MWARHGLVVNVLSFDFQFLFAGLADPAMFSINEGVVVDAFAVVFSAEITLHITEMILSHLRLAFSAPCDNGSMLRSRASPRRASRHRLCRLCGNRTRIPRAARSHFASGFSFGRKFPSLAENGSDGPQFFNVAFESLYVHGYRRMLRS